MSPLLLSYRIVSYRIASHRIASHRIISRRLISYCIVLYQIVSYGIVCIFSNGNHKIDIITINLILKYLVFRTRLKAIAPNRYTLYVSSNVLVAMRASKKERLFLLQLCIAVSVTSIFYTYGKNIFNTFDKSLSL